MSRLKSMGFWILTTYVSTTLCRDEKPTAPTNTTVSSNERVGWVSPDSRRSTWDILWSCLTVFLICSWKCTHLNLPSVAESEAGWHKSCAITWWPFSDPRKRLHLLLLPDALLLRKWGRKLGYMVLIAIAPEMVVALATEECVKAWRDVKKVNNPNYTMSHAFFARMGGFVVRIYEPKDGIEVEIDDQRKHSTSAGDVEKQADNVVKPQEYPCIEYALSLKGVAALEAEGVSFNTRSEDINDRAKADGFTKSFALVQAGWLVVQSIARTAAGLDITELELMTVAFTVCALATYILWWYKPFDAERAIIVDCPHPNTKIRKLLTSNYVTESSPGATRHQIRQLDSDMFAGLVGEVAPGEFSWASGALYLSSTTFSAIHLAAWNWMFPLPVVQTLWRAFSLAAVGSSVAPWLLISLFVLMGDFSTKILSINILEQTWAVWVFGGTLVGLVGVNVISRLALIGLTFYCFSSMPVGVYTGLSWTGFFPHFS